MFSDPKPLLLDDSPVQSSIMGQNTPVWAYQCGSDEVDLAGWLTANREEILAQLREFGVILFRGFGVDTIPGLRDFATTFTPDLVPYKERRSPRTDLGDNIYTSTIHPADQEIHFHNTTSFSHQWPMKLWFSCIQPAEWEGRTPLADIGAVLRRMDPGIRDKFERLGVMYVSNYYEGMGLSWQTTFGTEDRRDVEKYCEQHNIEYEWVGGSRLRTRSIRHAVAEHPDTGVVTWFNQAHHFHVTSLEPDVATALLNSYAPEDLPRNSYFGDGSPLTDDVLRHIADCYAAERTAFLWEKGDVIMIDNMLVAHARTPYRGERLIALALGEMYAGRYDGGGVVHRGHRLDTQELPLGVGE
jgi:alpha-ketoglutarate-dependent taurine dioxygenase